MFDSRLISNKWDGEVVWYWENGQPVKRLNYEQGVRHGQQLLFSRNGDVLIEGNYEQGVRHGHFQFINAKGEAMLAVSLKAGIAIKDESFVMSSKLGTFGEIDKALSIMEEEHFEPPQSARLYKSEELLKLIDKARENNGHANTG